MKMCLSFLFVNGNKNLLFHVFSKAIALHEMKKQAICKLKAMKYMFLKEKKNLLKFELIVRVQI